MQSHCLWLSVKLKANTQVDIVPYLTQLVSIERLSEFGNMMLYWEQNQKRGREVINEFNGSFYNGVEFKIRHFSINSLFHGFLENKYDLQSQWMLLNWFIVLNWYSYIPLLERK